MEIGSLRAYFPLSKSISAAVQVISFVIEKGFLWLLEKINEKIRQGFL